MYISELEEKVYELFSRESHEGDAAFPCIQSARVPIERLSLPQNLAAHSNSPRAYWSSRDSEFEALALGAVLSFTGAARTKFEFIKELLIPVLDRSARDVRFYGGASFAEGRHECPEWAKFGAYFFFIPRFEIINEGHECSLVVNCRIDLGERELRTCLTDLKGLQLTFGIEDPINGMPGFYGKRVDLPEKGDWVEKVSSVLEEFSKGELRKVVLARRSEFIPEKVSYEVFSNPTLLMRSLIGKTDNCFHYFVSPASNTGFMGASPELLYRRNGNDIFTEALAGTRPRGIDERESRNLSFDLLNSEKEFREHGMVQEVIERSLSDICDTWENTATRKIVKVSQCQHLSSSFSGKLKRGASDSLVLESLHPTPAVGVYPKRRLLEEISRYEDFSRGWYSGPVGWISAECAEFSVALRCGLVNANSLFLYAGAGIVEGSIPEQEWQETDNKLSSFMKAFY